MPGFLHPWLLAGLSAAAIPLIIHLFHRRRVVRIDWGAMRFLEELLVERVRRRRIEELLLLAVRMALLALVAFAISRPYLSGAMAGLLGGSAHRDVVIVLDGSDSMGRRGGDGLTLWERAKGAAGRLAGSFGTGDGLGIVVAAEVSRPLYDTLSYDPKRWREDLGALEAPGGGLELPRALEAAFTLLADGKNPFREVLLVTDRQRAGWALSSDAEWAFVAAAVEGLPVRPTFRVLPVDEPDTPRANLAVVELEPSRNVVGTDYELAVYASVANYGPRNASGYAVRFTLDGAPIETQPVGDLGSGKKARVRTLVRFETPGMHIVEASLAMGGAPAIPAPGAVGPADPFDAIPGDDARRLAVDVLETFPILLVDGDASLEPFRSETDFLRPALAPARPGAGPRRSTLIDPKIVPADRLGREDLAGRELVVLANVPKLSSEVREALNLAVAGGAGLVVFAGDKIDRDWYRDRLYRDGSGPLPAPFGETVTAPADRFFGIPQPRRADAWPLLPDATEIDVRDVRIQTYARLELAEGDPGVRVLVPLANGDPFIAEKRFGTGMVLEVATAADADWSNLPAHHVYVVLAHHLIYYASRGRSLARNLEIGEPIVLELERRPDLVTIVPPEGGPIPAEVRTARGRAVVEFAGTDRPGVYGVATQPSLPAPVLYAVERSPEEADLAPLAAADREAATLRAGAAFVDDLDRFLETYRSRERRTDLWLACMLGAIGMLLAETLLTRRITGRKAGAARVPEIEPVPTRGMRGRWAR